MFINQLFLDNVMVRGDRLFYLFLVIILLSLPVYSQTEAGFSDSKSYDFLYGKLTNSTPSSDVRSLSTIALIGGGLESGKLSGLIGEIKKLEDPVQHCWPSNNCRVKDSSLATLALALAGQDVTQEVLWLQSVKVAGLPSSGEWSVVIKAESDGTCKFSFSGGERTFNIEGEKVKLPTNQYTAKQYYVRLNEIHPSLPGEKQPVVNVQCEITNPIITLLYKPNENNFFIQRSDAGANLDLKVANVCFRVSGASGGCDYESTAYATWALVEIGLITNNQELSLEGIGTHIYLESQAALNKKNDPVALGLLNRILIKASNAAPSFISDLVNLQKISDGSWDSDVKKTSVAAFGLAGSDNGEELIRAQEFLKKKVGSDGSWNNDLESTSWALIALKGELSKIFVSVSGGVSGGVEVCGNGLDDDQDGLFDCGELECMNDPLCQCQNGFQDLTEDGIDCGGNCPDECESVLGGCVVDFDCDVDEVCASGECVKKQQSSPAQTNQTGTQTESKKETGAWLWIIVVLVVLGLLLFFYVKYVKTGKINFGNLFKRKPKGQTFDAYKRQTDVRQVQRPTAPLGRQMPSSAPPRQQAGRSKDDLELEKSLKEAEKLLRGK